MKMGQFRETQIFQLLSIALFVIQLNILLLSDYTVCNCTKELYKDLPTCCCYVSVGLSTCHRHPSK